MKHLGVILAMTGILAVSCFGNSLWLLCVLFPPESCEVVEVIPSEESSTDFCCGEQPPEPVFVCVPVDAEPVFIVQLTSTPLMSAQCECFWDPLELTAVLGKDHQPEDNSLLPLPVSWTRVESTVRIYFPVIDRPPGIHPAISSTILII